ncbi:MAG: radical SAM family heme chaperone HemW, partial [Phycisphaerales bacterium]|nr:radical SAM family heme chaperone HemW [Phycisphaerales bacterium]
CGYCDFNSYVVEDRSVHDTFLEALERELAASWRGAPPVSVFIGGGTPSLLRPDLWERLLGHLGATFGLTPDTEFTVECNPETVTPELMATLKAGGVNRVSVGAQSFNPRHLTTLERHHDPDNVARALELAAAAGITRLSLDLIFGIPGQTLAEWGNDLDRALALGITHISCYALTYEPGTAMTRRLELGQFEAIDEDTEADMFELTLARLQEAGLARYEISNFARPGQACRHNLVYWRQGQWLAAGPSASGHAGGFRWKNVPRLGDWMAGVRGDLDGTVGASPITDLEYPDPRRAFAERLLMGLRLTEGVPLPEIDASVLALGSRRLPEIVARHVKAGLMTADGEALRLTDAGFLIADTVIGDLVRAVLDVDTGA